MNGNNKQSECEQFELLISCGLDGELTHGEQTELSDHLAQCSSCRQRSMNFLAVNRLAERLGVVDAAPALKVVVPSTAIGGIEEENLPTGWFAYAPHAAMAALAVAGVVWLGALIPNSNYADANKIIVPLVSLVQINSTRQEDQVFFKESLQLDMRTLRLQIDSLDNQDQLGELKKRYEQLLKRIKEI